MNTVVTLISSKTLTAAQCDAVRTNSMVTPFGLLKAVPPIFSAMRRQRQPSAGAYDPW